MGTKKTQKQNEWIRENKDRINFTADKGYKEIIKKRAEEKGFNSVGEYLKDLIARDMAGGGTHKDTIE